MGRPDSQDLRERVVDAAGATSRRQAAKRFGVGAATAVRWMTALATTGIVAARPQERAHRSKLDPHEAFLRGLIAMTEFRLAAIHAFHHWRSKMAMGSM
jgi:transposase